MSPARLATWGRRALTYGGLTLLLAFLFGYILLPMMKTVETSVMVDGAASMKHYVDLFASPLQREPLLNSILLGVLTVLLCGAIGISLAFLLHYFEFPCGTIFDKLLLLPVVIPGIVIVLSFVQLYGESGMVTKGIQLVLGLKNPPFILSGLPGILVIHAYTQYVYFYIAVSIAIRHIDLCLVESARNLGASKLRVFWTVILPTLKPGLLAAAAMTFITGASSFTAPSIVGGGFKVLTTQILLAKTNNYMDIAATQVTVLTAVAFVFFALFRFYEGKSSYTSSARATFFRPVPVGSGWKRFFLVTTACLFIITILLPVAAIILVSFVPSRVWMTQYFPRDWTLENYTAIAASYRKMQPFINSTVMSLAAAAIALAVALPSSFLIVKSKMRVRWPVEAIVMLPWAVPASAIAINMINGFSLPSIFSFNAVLIGTTILLPLAYAIRSLPIMVKTINISLQNLNPAFIEASKSLGASPLTTFYRVSVPIIFPGILAGVLLVCIRSIGEYTVSVFLYTAANKPLSIAMVNGVFEYNLGLAMAYGSLLILLTLVVSLFISKILSFSVR